ncbi:hypothetical protein HNR34_001856 [Geobacillus subterraneus]
MLIHLELDEAKQRLLFDFFETYLRLSDEEEIRLRNEVNTMEEKRRRPKSRNSSSHTSRKAWRKESTKEWKKQGWMLRNECWQKDRMSTRFMN